MSSEIEGAILKNLEKLKESTNFESDQKTTSTNENPQTVTEEIIEDKFIENLPRFQELKRSHLDFESKRWYFDQIYFKNSKLIKMYLFN